MGPTGYPETSVEIYLSTLRKIPEKAKLAHIYLLAPYKR